MRTLDRIEQSGADRWRDSYPERATHGEHIANLFGVARIWKRITFWTYLVAIVLMFAPVGHVLHYVGVILWTAGLLPLISWLVSRFFFRKAVKNVVKQ
jgi:ATP/ADP translocase